MPKLLPPLWVPIHLTHMRSRIHSDYATIVASTTGSTMIDGAFRKRTDRELQSLDTTGKLVRIPVDEIEEQQRGKQSLMLTGLFKTLKAEQFAYWVKASHQNLWVHGSAN